MATEETRQILCFGDSNTWGFNPENGERHPYNVRWTSVMEKAMGSSYRIIVEGMNGRTTVFEDPVEPGRSGLDYLVPSLVSHKPLDAVLFMLGTNDTKYRFGLLAVDIALGMKRLVKTIQAGDYGISGETPKIGIIAPPQVNEWVEEGPFTGAHEISVRLAHEYRLVAKELDCAFFDASEHVFCKIPDGIHLDGEAHEILGKKIADWVEKTLPI
jgi:lysophospholipase L1-like esterase